MNNTNLVSLRGLFLILCCCLILVSGCVTTRVKKLEAEHQARPLPPDEVLALVEGNTLFLKGFGEDTYLYFDPSSRLFGKDIYNNKDLGRWDVSEDGELCLRMNSWWYGDLRCFQVLASGNQYKLASSGVVQYTASQLPGDSKNLFYAIKKKKRSYRRSARAARTAPVARNNQPTAQSATAEPSEKPRQALVEERTPSAELAEKNIRSTLKWMARDCPGCNLAGTDLKKADLVAAELNNANLQGAVLRMANLRRANLAGANLEGADLSRANMPGANLRGANLKNANLRGANLIRADLTGARIDGADFTGALLESVQGLPARP
jgi:hypothetical protein